jgi:hypothetical protein
MLLLQKRLVFVSLKCLPISLSSSITCFIFDLSLMT